jgi:hypothetical protein
MQDMDEHTTSGVQIPISELQRRITHGLKKAHIRPKMTHRIQKESNPFPTAPSDRVGLTNSSPTPLARLRTAIIAQWQIRFFKYDARAKDHTREEKTIPIISRDEKLAG